MSLTTNCRSYTPEMLPVSTPKETYVISLSKENLYGTMKISKKTVSFIDVAWLILQTGVKAKTKKTKLTLVKKSYPISIHESAYN